MSIELALLTSLITTVLAVLSAAASYRKNSRREGIREGQQQATLEHIKNRVDELWAGHRRFEARMMDLERRLTILELEQQEKTVCKSGTSVVSYPQ